MTGVLVASPAAGEAPVSCCANRLPLTGEGLIRKAYPGLRCCRLGVSVWSPVSLPRLRVKPRCIEVMLVLPLLLP